MHLPVLIQPKPGTGYVATVASLGWTAEGATADEALQRIRERAADTVAGGGRVTEIDIPPGPNPLMASAGELKDHPLLEEWRQAVAEYRQQIENDPDR